VSSPSGALPIADRPRQETLAGVYDWVEKQAAAE